MWGKRLPFPVPSSPGLAPSISLSLGKKDISQTPCRLAVTVRVGLNYYQP